jgi:hypothetical protein
LAGSIGATFTGTDRGGSGESTENVNKAGIITQEVAKVNVIVRISLVAERDHVGPGFWAASGGPVLFTIAFPVPIVHAPSKAGQPHDHLQMSNHFIVTNIKVFPILGCVEPLSFLLVVAVVVFAIMGQQSYIVLKIIDVRKLTQQKETSCHFIVPASGKFINMTAAIFLGCDFWANAGDHHREEEGHAFNHFLVCLGQIVLHGLNHNICSWDFQGMGILFDWEW